MCYRDNVAPLSFAGIHTASISGGNGHGKSALIDAMTWALWGQSRARRDDDLVHAGTTEATVEFDFAVEGQEYRVIRRHSLPKRRSASGKTNLEFQIRTGDGYRPLTGNTIAETQQKIIEVLHMDYDTFINSAFLRQGHADEFTTASPAHRKEVLASILGLGEYDRLEERAKEQASRLATRRQQLEGGIRDMTEELTRRPALQEELAEAEEARARSGAALKEHRHRLEALRQQMQALEARRTRLDELQQRIGQDTRNLEHWQEQAGRYQALIKRYRDILARRQEIEAGYTRLVRARQTSHQLDQAFQRSVVLQQQKARLEQVIKDAEQELLRQHALVRQTVADLEATSGRLPEIRARLRQARQRLEQLEEQEKLLQHKQEELRKLQAELHGLETSQKRLSEEITSIEEKLELLHQSGPTATCPLCESKLGTDGLQRIESKFTHEKQEKAGALSATRRRLEEEQARMARVLAEVSQLEQHLKEERAAIQARTGALRQESAEAENASQALQEERARLALLEERLARRDFAHQEQQALARIEEELAALAYDADRHEAARQELADLEQWAEPKRQLEEAEEHAGAEERALARVEEAIRDTSRSLEENRQTAAALEAEIAGMKTAAHELAEAEAKNSALVAEHERLQQVVGSLRGQLERLNEVEKRLRERRRQVEECAREEDIYRELAEAFGKRGIQALLIETALPEVEQEANRLLGLMTDNRMHVRIETQRETKRGTTVETLDIFIADELGTRNYEMFSGGEAFRINFAIRIALSRLLARRAGAPLPTLIIDEGFGTQDAVGIEKLQEAINSIQDEFQKILVITHMEELRDAFPTRIEVTKTASGSRISLN